MCLQVRDESWQQGFSRRAWRLRGLARYGGTVAQSLSDQFKRLGKHQNTAMLPVLLQGEPLGIPSGPVEVFLLLGSLKCISSAVNGYSSPAGDCVHLSVCRRG